MNVKVNMLIANLNEVNYIDVFPSCGDESNIFGAAYITRQLKEKNNDIHLLKNYTIGTDPSYDLDEAIQLFKNKIVIKKVDDINTFIATQLAKNKLVARCSGPMEFGARALGNRSILAHPYDLKTVGKINRAVKKRDFWMPFAPAILDQYADQYIDIPESLSVQKSPYMMFGFNSIPEKRNDYICGIHQSDFTTRPIIVTEKRYSDLYKIIQSFREITNIPVLLNTSFNLHGFPIVENSHQAIEVFLKTELDLLVINSTVIWKK